MFEHEFSAETVISASREKYFPFRERGKSHAPHDTHAWFRDSHADADRHARRRVDRIPDSNFEFRRRAILEISSG
jgi:hypothetical protein